MIVDVLHNILPERVAFCYRQGDSESLEIAQYYQSKRLLPSENLIPLPCSDENEINESEFNSQILNPLRSALSALSSDTGYGPREHIWCIVLGFNVPKIYTTDSDSRIAIASRLHRLNYGFELKKLNHTFDRKSFRYFDDRDHSQLYITAVLDGPTKQDVINLIDRSIRIDNQGYVSGSFLLDPYGNRITDYQIEYQDEILEFISRDVSRTGLEYVSTVDIEDPYQDPTVTFLDGDSFYWGWAVDVASPQMFKPTEALRAFSYNADNYGAADLKDEVEEGGAWCNVSLKRGYAATAGAVDVVDSENEFLHIRPFFDALHRGACLGEAFLFANRYVNGRLMLIGDPLMVVSFPLKFRESLLYLNNNEIIYKTIRAIEDYLSRIDRLDRQVNDAVDHCLAFKTFDVIDIFQETSRWQQRIANFETARKFIGNLTATLVSYCERTTGTKLSQWILSQGLKVSGVFADAVEYFSSDEIDDSYLSESGSWSMEFVYDNEDLVLKNVHFIIEISQDSSFSSVLLTIDSSVTVDGWLYEKEVNEFYALPTDGLPSNYSGRRVRYVSTADNSLSAGEKYFYRIYNIV